MSNLHGILKPKVLFWTEHAKAKMRHYGLSESRVRRVLHSPRRTEEGVAPKTKAAMQPTSLKRINSGGVPARGFNSRFGEKGKRKAATLMRRYGSGNNDANAQTWTQEIWVMFRDDGERRKIISAWRYPGRSKPRSEAVKDILREEYRSYSSGEN